MSSSELQVLTLHIFKVLDPVLVAFLEGSILIGEGLVGVGGLQASLVVDDMLGDVILPEGSDGPELIVILKVERQAGLGLSEGVARVLETIFAND